MTRTRLDCRDHIYAALVNEMTHRRDDPGLAWIGRERQAVADAATRWARANNLDRTVTAADVERIEGAAIGHSDYASKLALYIAELVTTPGAS